MSAVFDKPLDATKSAKANVNLANAAGVIAGNADFYAWGLEDADDVNETTLGGGGYDLRSVGVQSFDAAAALGNPAFAGQQLIVFAVNAHDRSRPRP